MPWCWEAKPANLSAHWGEWKLLLFSWLKLFPWPRDENWGKNVILIILMFQLCSLVSLQHYVKGLSATQLATAVEKTKQRPHDRMQALTDVRFFLLHWDICSCFLACNWFSLRLAGCKEQPVWKWLNVGCLWHFYWEAICADYWPGPWGTKGIFCLFQW